MHRLGVVGEHCKAENVLLHGGGGEDIVAVVRGGSGGVDGSRGGGDLVPETAASLGSGVSGVSLCASMSSLTDDDDDAESFFPVVGDGTWSSSSSEEEEDDTMLLQLDGDDGGGPLYEMSPLLVHLPVRTGLSKYYQGKSQSFTSLSEVKCVDDLAKKTIPYSSRMKACRGCDASGTHASRSSILSNVSGPYSKTISKKTMKIEGGLLIACRQRQQQGARASCEAAANHVRTRERKSCAVHMLAKPMQDLAK